MNPEDIFPPPSDSVLPREALPFQGVIGDTYKDSVAHWPQPTRPPESAPNVIIIMCDDLGFGQLSCFGGPIEAPRVAALAANGLRFTNFHTTALCSPTRAALLTGRNHHSVGFSAIVEMAKGFPGHSTYLPKSAASIAEVLRQTGYSTYCSGKWHLTPFAEATAAGPFDRWPLGLGFERYYGFIPAISDHWHPMLTVDNHRIPAPLVENYHLSEDLVTQAIRMLRDQRQIASGRPVFLYVPFGAPHAPFHAPAEFIEKYRGKFDVGWDVVRQRTYEMQKKLGVIPSNCDLPPRDPSVREWDNLSTDERKLFARQMEAFAGMVEHADAQIGRLVDELKALDMLDNTLIIFLSDNGASQEGMDSGTTCLERLRNLMPQTIAEMMPDLDDIGAPGSDVHYPKGWAMAGNAPFRRYKRDTHRGANTDPLVVHWPARIKDRGAIRTQYTHVTDIYPTLLEVIGLATPAVVNGVKQQPLEGQSFAKALFDADAPTIKTVQYYEMLGSRAIWSNGWTAVTWHKPGTDWDHDNWELYHQDEDYSQAHDLAGKDPERLQNLIKEWWEEARKHNVLPLDDRGLRFYDPNQPRASINKQVYSYYPGTSPIPNQALPILLNRRYTISVHATLTSHDDEGVLVAAGGSLSGWALYVRGRQLVYVHNNLRICTTSVPSQNKLPIGREVCIRCVWEPVDVGVGKVQLFVDDELVGALEHVPTAPLGLSFSQDGLQIGRSWSTPVDPGHYSGAFEFSGALRVVKLEVAPENEFDRELDSKLQRMSSGA